MSICSLCGQLWGLDVAVIVVLCPVTMASYRYCTVFFMSCIRYMCWWYCTASTNDAVCVYVCVYVYVCMYACIYVAIWYSSCVLGSGPEVLSSSPTQAIFPSVFHLPPTSPTSPPSCDWGPGICWGANSRPFLMQQQWSRWDFGCPHHLL